MFENLKRYREKMDKYRSSLNMLHVDSNVYFYFLEIIFNQCKEKKTS